MSKFAHLIYTYDRITEAKINQELSKEIFDVPIIHAYNGPEKLGYAPYLENECIRIENRGHYRGAVDLVNVGVTAAEKTEAEYLLVTAADTWLVEHDYIDEILVSMRTNKQYLALSSWGMAGDPITKAGFSFDFFLLDLNWQREHKFFPLDYDGYVARYQDLYFAFGGDGQLTVEKAFSYFWMKHWSARVRDNNLSRQARKRMYRMTKREPNLYDNYRARTMAFPEIGLYMYHDPEKQTEVLRGLSERIRLGSVASQKLVTQTSTE